MPMALAKKFGASHYSTFRRYVTTNPAACCVVVLEPSARGSGDAFAVEVRRVVVSKSFHAIYDGQILGSTVTASHPLASVVPANGRRMTREREIVLVDRNQDEGVCIAEAFDTKRQILVLVSDVGRRTRSGIVLPSF